MSPQTLRSIVLCGMVSLLFTGCEQILVETGDKSEAPPANSTSPSQQGGFLDESHDATAAAEANHAQPPAAPANPNTGNPADSNTAAAPPPASNNQPAIRLSAGVALAQTLPNGTGMSFSVDYQFQNGQPNPSNKYIWVIQRGDGKSLGQPIQLARKGTLPIIVPGLRPETGPFKSQIVEITPDGSQQKISNTINLR